MNVSSMLIIEVMIKHYSLCLLFSPSLEFYSQCANVLTKAKLTADRGSRPDMFFKKAILENLAKLKKTPVPESLFNKASSLQPGTSLKKAPAQVLSFESCEIFKAPTFRITAAGCFFIDNYFATYFLLCL